MPPAPPSERDVAKYYNASLVDRNPHASKDEIMDALAGLQSADTIPWDLCRPILVRLQGRLMDQSGPKNNSEEGPNPSYNRGMNRSQEGNSEALMTAVLDDALRLPDDQLGVLLMCLANEKGGLDRLLELYDLAHRQVMDD